MVRIGAWLGRSTKPDLELGVCGENERRSRRESTSCNNLRHRILCLVLALRAIGGGCRGRAGGDSGRRRATDDVPKGAWVAASVSFRYPLFGGCHGRPTDPGALWDFLGHCTQRLRLDRLPLANGSIPARARERPRARARGKSRSRVMVGPHALGRRRGLAYWTHSSAPV